MSICRHGSRRPPSLALRRSPHHEGHGKLPSQSAAFFFCAGFLGAGGAPGLVLPAFLLGSRALAAAALALFSLAAALLRAAGAFFGARRLGALPTTSARASISAIASSSVTVSGVLSRGRVALTPSLLT